MNVFEKIVSAEWDLASRLGCPSSTPAEFLQRQERMAALNPRGFRSPRKSPRKNAQGKTRGDRKREAYASMVAKIKAEQKARADEAAELAAKFA